MKPWEKYQASSQESETSAPWLKYQSQGAEGALPIEIQTENAPNAPISRVEALLATSTNVPFAPRIKAGIAAGTAKLFGGEATTNESLGTLYDEALQNERQKLEQAREQFPIQSFASQLPADIEVGGKLLKAAGMTGRTIKSSIAGAGALGALQAAGESKELLSPETVGEATLAGGIGAATAGLLGVAGKGYQALFNKNAGEAVRRMTATDVKELAGKAYKNASEKGGIVKPEFIDNLIKKASEADKQTTIGKALAGQSPIAGVKEVLQSFQGKKLDLASLQELDEVLGDKIDDYVENGVIKKAGLPLLKLQQSLRDMVEDASPSLIEGGKEGFEALKQGRTLWSKAAKLRDIEKIISRAEMYDNPATAIKNGFRTLFNNPNKLKYFNKEERALIEKAAKSGITTDILRTFGSRLIPIGSVIADGGLSGIATGQVTSMASRNLATKAQMARATQVADQILGNLQKKEAPYKTGLLTPYVGARIGSTLAGE